jgi:hypothetical protein
MNTYVIALLSALLVMIALLLIIIIVLLIFLFKNYYSFNKKEKQVDQKEDEIPSSFCTYHPDLEAKGICVICGDTLCERCLKTFEKLHFCPDHLKMYLKNKWVSIAKVRTTPEKPEKGIILYQFKDSIWEETNLPSFIMTHYKINTVTDSIESEVQLYVKEDDAQDLSAKLQSQNNITDIIIESAKSQQTS